jgi:tripartite-type tricarboxylate transporter receptor subunit TctC
MRRWIIGIGVFILILSVVGCAGPTGGIKAEDFYKGNTITMIVPYRAGGGTDNLARVIASYLEAHTGASVKVENKEAAGGLEGHNYLYETAKQDGLTVGVTEASALWADALLGAEGIRYKIGEFGYLGIMQTTVHMLFVEKNSPINTIDDLKQAKGLKLGVGGAITSSGGLSYGVVIENLGLDAKIIPGFRGSAETILALQKGEIDAVAFPGEGMQKYVDEGTVKPLFSISNDREYAFYKDVPAFGELVSLSKEAKKMLDVLVDLRGCKALIITPGAPADRVDYLQKVFVDMAERADFQDAAGKAMGYWPGYVTGDKAAKLVAGLIDNEALFPAMKALALKYSAAQ